MTKKSDEETYPRRWVMGTGYVYAPQEVTVKVPKQEVLDMNGPAHPDYESGGTDPFDPSADIIWATSSDAADAPEEVNLSVAQFFTEIAPPTPVSKPYSYHYHAADGGVEPIDLIVSQDMSFLEGNIVKYVTRWRRKDGQKDLQKAKVYLGWLIEDAERNPGKYV